MDAVTVAPVKLAVLAASPVYYQTPLYRRLAADPRLDFTAVFASTAGLRPHETGYGEPVVWDIDMLSGYKSRFLRRAGRNSAGGHFFALRDLDVVGELRRGRYEALWIHGYYSMTHVIAALAQRVRGVPVLFREEQTLLHARPRARAAAKDIGLSLLFRDAFGLYIGTENRRWFERYGIPSERLFAVPYCVENARLRRDAAVLGPESGALRRELGIGADSGPVILTVARLIPKKQPEFLLEVFRRVRAETLCTLLIVGSGELEQKLRAQVEQDAIPDVVFAGFLNQSEVAKAYICADAFVLLSRMHETWGLVVNEAMNFGLPVLASDKVGSATDLVLEGETGFRVPAADAEAAVMALRRLVTDPELRSRLGQRASEHIVQWSYDASARGIVDAVAAAVGRERWAAAAPRAAAKEEAACAA